MKKFILKIFLFIAPVVVVVVAFIIIYHESLPAPKITSSLSLNEKLIRFRRTKADFLVIGSSMSLSNFNSERMVKWINSDSYFNFSSWGSKMHDSWLQTRIYCSYHQPKIVFINSNIVDFRKEDIVYDEKEVEKYFQSYPWNDWWYYLNHIDVNYYLVQAKDLKPLLQTDLDYSSLLFDKYGAIPFGDTNFKKEDDRWNEKHDTIKALEFQYECLDSLSDFLMGKKIKFVFIYCPTRKELSSSYQAENILNNKKRVKEIVEKHGGLFYDSSEIVWDDSLFVDSIHFNKKGSATYTDSCMKKVLPYLIRD